jgi:RHS repeat-associated protein
VQYYAGRPVAYWLAADGNIHFEHQDWLGTERVRTTKAGVLEGSYTSLPFGDAFSASGTDTNIGHFAQLDHDMSASSGLEHATFREYNSTRGRWLNPDSYLGSYNEGNPQSFNRYTYVGNNPLTATDASGLMMNLNINDPGIGVEAQEADAAAWNADAWFNGKVGPSEGNYGNPFNDPLANPNNPIYNPSQIIDDGGQTDNGVVQTQVTIDCTGDFISGFQCTVGSPSTSYEENVFAGAFMNALSNSSGNYPTRMFGTHWCGPGGAGPTVNQLDAACQAHDGCYDRGYNGKAFTPLSNWDPFQSPGRVQALQQCNQNLCNAAAQTNDPGSIRVILFFTSVPVGACYSIP